MLSFLQSYEDGTSPHKSCSIGYIWDNGRRRGLLSPFNINGVDIPFANLNDSIKYLGTPVAARKISKLKTSSEYCNKFKQSALQIFNSDLLIVQKIHAIKTFVFPTIDFILENGQLKVKDIEKLDSFIAANINKLFSGNIPTAVKHASWKDGGLSIPKLRDKAESARVKSLTRMLTNNDNNVNLLFEKAIEDERCKRHIETIEVDDSSTFLNWKSYDADPHKGTNSLVQRARKSLSNLNMSLTRTLDNNLLDAPDSQSTPNKLFTLKDKSTNKSHIFSNSKSISLFLTTSRRDFWINKAVNKSFHLHSLFSFTNNPLSNQFVINQKHPVSDNFIKFAIRSRVNILGTPEFDEIIHNSSHKPCPLCRFTNSNSTQSLSHILNGCVRRYPLYTERHNRIQNIVKEALKEMPNVASIFCDKTLQLDFLADDLKLLRPDIVAWNEDNSACIIAEISVPYPTTNWNTDSLKLTYENKKNKYANLVQALRNHNIKVELFVIIVSSLGSIYIETRNDINKLIKCKKKAKTLMKRLAANAIIGSMEIWNNFHKYSEPDVNDQLQTDPDIPEDPPPQFVLDHTAVS